jgi:YegS/Rv2252/BmrU family lipid kinase
VVKAVLFANAASGRGRTWLFKVVEAAPEVGVDIVSTSFDMSPRGIESGLALAKQEGISTVLAMGGDGTVGTVGNCLLGGDWTLGVLPSGTSNDFARSIGLQLDPVGALRTIAAGHTARLDVGLVNGRAFLHAAAVGLNTEFAEEAGKLRKFLGRASYPLAAISVFRNPHPFDARIEVDGAVHSYRALEVIVLNSPVVGGALELEAAALNLQDGKASTLIVERLDLMTLVRALPLALQRRILRFPGLEVVSASALRLVTEPRLRVTVDGEIGDWTPVNIDVRQRALRVLVPAQFTSSNDESPQ